jgi:cytosine/adenosine deaminase-related metal-dependent hydrolase
LYLKFSAAQIFDGFQFLPPHTVLVTTQDGTIADIIRATDAGDDIQYWSGLICPGFINAHCHLELSHLKGQVPRHTGLVDFLTGVMFNRQASPQQKEYAMQQAEQEMLANGIVAVGDICNTTDSLSLKQLSSLQFYNFIEATGFMPASAHNRFSAAVNTAAAFQALPYPCSIVPHAPYSVSPALMALINEASLGQCISLHSQEAAAENEFFLTGTGEFLRLYQQLGIDIGFYKAPGKSSLQAVWPQLDSASNILLVHNVALLPEDIRLLQKDGTASTTVAHLCICPNANLYIGGQLPAVNDLAQTGINIVLGTDSLASNHQLCLVHEMAVLQQHFPQLPLATLLQWTTANGAAALGMQHRLGSITIGKKPGLVGITVSAANMVMEKGPIKRLI